MIEAGMYMALGFLGATLIALMIVPAITRRADRLARRRAEAAFPISLEQVAADRDHLRAELALREREMQRRLEDGFAQRAAALESRGRRDRDNAQLRQDLAQRESTIDGLSAELAGMTGDRDRLATALAAEQGAHAATTEARRQLETEAQRLNGVLQERHEEMGALQRRIAELQQDIAGFKAEMAALTLRLESQASTLAQLTAERDRLASELERAQAAIEAAQAEKAALEQAFMARGQEVDEQRHLAFAHGSERDALAHELKQARDAAAALQREREETARQLLRQQRDAERELKTAVDRLRRSEDKLAALQASRASADQSVLQLREERARLKQAATVAKRETERLEATLRQDNGALRAEMMKLAQAMLHPSADSARKGPVVPTPANPEGLRAAPLRKAAQKSRAAS